MAYLAITLWVIADVAPRAANLAEVPVADLTGTQRHFTGAVLTLVAAVLVLVGAVLLMRGAVKGTTAASRYAAPSARRATAVKQEEQGEPMSERMLWDALDEGHDPTDRDTKGR
jgi:uncharacterized membrane protein (TIGR02234 family)